ncbi:MAG: glutathione-regulated potassium-efflux system protein KefC [Methanomassiliicoccales archaeon PtaU1.Bin030]|nr:MAG: glutathione-regulated potassium-efflux system protein KefC [Methanomassiliicoccales archaeon PtaU1.Bin030]
MSGDVRVVVDMALLLGLSGVLSIIFVKLKMPPILGYLGAGIVLGPSMLPELWVEGNTVALLSNIGIVLLMFYIGLETDVRKLKASGSKLLFVVCLQMPLVVAAGYLTGILLGLNTVQSIFLGAIISGTSTAVVVGVLHESRHIDKDMARTIVNITIFEDVGQVIILTMASPLLAGDSPALGSTFNMILGLILFISLAIVFGTVFVPRLLNFIGGRFSSEILLIVAVGLCFSLAAISAEMGLSIAIGAFIMGMMISISKYSRRLMTEVEPLKDLFMAVFFISIGLQISPLHIWENIVLAAIIAAVFIVSKITTVWLGCYLVNMTAKDSLLIATSLIAMGEFAFIIAKAAFDAGVVNEGFYSAVIGAALITMMVMPIMTKRQPKMFDHISKLLPERVRCSLARIDDVHTAVAMKNSRTPNAARAEIKKLISLIFVDILIALMVMIFFTNLERFSARLFDALSGLLLLPSELLMLILIIVMAPIVYNMYSNVRAIARVLTKQVMESSRGSWMNERGVYLMFANLGTIALVLILLLILLPFIPQVVFRPVGVALVGLGAILILYLSWDTVKRAYDRFCKFMASEPEREEKENP